MRSVTPFNDPAALRLSTSCRSETIYGEIKALKLEQRLLVLRTLNHQELTVVLLPQIWAHELVNLGKPAKPLQDLNSALVPGRWLMLRCMVYGSEQSLVIEAQELVLTSRDPVERLAHHPNWWRNQIVELADFYLRHLFGSSEQPKLDYSRYRTFLGLNGNALTDGRQETAVLSRLVYGFATAYLMTGRPLYLEAAQAGSAYLADHFCQTDGADGFTYWVHGLEFQQDGHLLQPRSSSWRITSTSSGVCIAPSRSIKPRDAWPCPLKATPKPTPAVDGTALARSGSSGTRTTPGELLDGSSEKWLSFRVASGSAFDVA